MASKVFLFDNHSWLYCSVVTHKNGIWTGWVENGYWYLIFNEINGLFQACRSKRKEDVLAPVTITTSKLVWACDTKHHRDYNVVIEDAKERHKSGEEANFVIAPPKKRVKNEYDDEVAF